ncbi:helix-turn-helix domain-containing protein [Mucilaginibacter sp. dw_454]|uniref:helix-turn-helix domain-containing protein n=1 Tax=Mucilaginibacter sp. dw_454 TaxID=2720079 RepID=UPI001BD56C9E|nr:helix-turn-helix domain-containing protein [Mucilaginibacter sp. dw_454]
MTPDELLTRKDLDNFKKELFELLQPLTKAQGLVQQKWLKNKDVRKLLQISDGTLANLRINGTLTFHKIGGTYLYRQSDIDKMLSDPEKKSPKTK